MKRIAIVTDNAQTYSGREAICDFMTNIYSFDNLVDIYSVYGKGHPHYEFKGAENIFSFGSENKSLLMCLNKINKMKYDYVFVVSMGRLSVVFSALNLVFRRNKKVKFIACEHVSFQSLSFPVRVLKKLFMRFYSNIIVLTDVDKNIYKKLKIDCLKIENPVEWKGYVREKRNFKAIVVGRLSYQKNIIELIDIWAKFKKMDDNYKLYIIGDGEERSNIEARILELKLNESIILVGKVPKVDDFYKQSDFCLMTSKYEGLPLALLESKSWSLPVISYDCPTGPREIIENEVDGYLVKNKNQTDFLECLKLISSNDSIYFNMVNNTRETSLKFSKTKIIYKWKNLLEN